MEGQLFTTQSPAETASLAHRLAAALRPGMTVLLRGELGAGKTAFAQGVLAALGAEPPYTSPTFVIMKQYDLTAPSVTGVRRVYHVDTYRVDEDQLRQVGFEDWTADPEGLVLCEWPERLGALAPDDAATVALKAGVAEGERRITLSGIAMPV